MMVPSPELRVMDENVESPKSSVVSVSEGEEVREMSGAESDVKEVNKVSVQTRPEELRERRGPARETEEEVRFIEERVRAAVVETEMRE